MKLIEVALPLDAINKASVREKSLRHGHPSTLHLWWARQPLAACRAVLWASLVDDPSAHPERFPTEEDQAVERERLFGILEDLVVWENSNNQDVLREARAEIERCFDGELPAVLDPFAGGGSIPLEAQRFGLRALAGDLNPVAVLINRAMVEIPKRFAGRPPVHPDKGDHLSKWSRAEGLAADVRAYGAWMRDEAERRIGHLYPDVVAPDGEKLTPVAWLWARTVPSPDPAWDGDVPLVQSWTLRKAKKGKPEVWVEPVVDSSSRTISYKLNYGGSRGGVRAPTVRRGNGACVATGAAIPVEYTRAEGRAGRMGAHLLAVVGKGVKGRVYCEPSPADFNACREAVKSSADAWKPAGSLPPRGKGLGLNVQNYGVEEWWQLFTDRQLLALTTFSDLLDEVHGRVLEDAQTAGLADDGVRLREGGTGALAYADAVVTYLALVVDKCAGYWSNLVIWNSGNETLTQVFGRQAVSMVWDYAEGNPFSSSSGNWMAMVNWVGKVIDYLPSLGVAEVCQQDARVQARNAGGVVVSTAPPYYDNTGYADISDFFYVWMRRNLGDVWPEECATLLTPKALELIADSSRHESKQEAKEYFESGMAEFMSEVVSAQHPDVPATVYYAYKATEHSEDGSVRSTGWSTFLQAVIDAGLQVTATWPLRTALVNRLLSLGTNALASSIVLVCRPRPSSAPLATRSEFIAALRGELPYAIQLLQSGNLAPADLPQSTIGPGIGVFSRYAKVVEASGASMPVSDALAVINEVLDDVLHGVESELDSDSRFALDWYEQYGFEPGPFGDADIIARAKNISVAGVEEAGIGEASGGEFRLFKRSELEELDANWDPASDTRLTAWEALQYLVARLEQSESQAALLMARLGGVGDRARQLAYLLHKIASDKRWAEEALAYNSLILVWQALRATIPRVTQQNLLME